MNGSVNDESGRIDVQSHILDQSAVHVHLDQTGGCNFLVEKAKRIDQVVLMGAWHSDRNVVVNPVRHPEMRHEPIAGSQVNPGLPFFRADLLLDLLALFEELSQCVVVYQGVLQSLRF